LDLHTAIQQRRTLRKFLSPPTEEQLQKLWAAGALTGLNIGVPDPSYVPNKKILKPTVKWIFREKWMGE
jgi:nitroreductase